MLTAIPDDDSNSEASDFTPLTFEQAQALRERQPSISPWWVVVGQVVMGALVALAAWVITGKLSVVWSAMFGVLAVVVPAALFARGLTSQFARANAGSAVVSFFLWELIKIAVTVGMLLLAGRLVKDLSWPVMLVGMVLTMKVYWLALGFKRARPANKN